MRGLGWLIAAVLLLPGSASEQHVHMDEATSMISFPLDEYALDFDEGIRVEHANAVLIAACMAESDLPYPAATLDWSSRSRPEDRRFGVWSRLLAEQYGYQVPPDAWQAHVSSLDAEFDQAWFDTRDHCFESTPMLPVRTVLNAADPSVVDVGIVSAHEATLATAEFAAIRADWVECIQRAGLRAAEDSGLMVPDLPDDPSDQMTAARVDADCKHEDGRIQRLSDIEAGFQRTFIGANRADLEAFRRSAAEALDAADRILDEGSSSG